MRLGKVDIEQSRQYGVYLLGMISQIKVCALHNQPISYGGLADKIDLHFFNAKGEKVPYDHSVTNHRTGYAALLGTIFEFSYQQGKVILPSFVVLERTRIPGEGFFTLAVRKGLLEEKATDIERVAFVKKEQSRAFRYMNRCLRGLL